MKLPYLQTFLSLSSPFDQIPLNANAPDVPANPVVTNPQTHVKYQGITVQGIDQYLGIKYATSTRFSAPRPFAPRSGSLVNAKTKGAACPQPEVPLPSDPWTVLEDVSEDCLTLRIARPHQSIGQERPYPVLVWFYGGGHAVGDTYDANFDPQGLVSRSIGAGADMLVVGVQYRTNFFGFAASEALDDGSTNLGLRDQALAIEWVRDNIAAFGGDPDSITLVGEDSGAVDATLHLFNPKWRHSAPFRHIAAQSGAVTATNVVRLKDDSGTFDEVAREAGCTHGSVTRTLSCLRALEMEDLVNATFTVAWRHAPGNGAGVFSPVVDGDIIPASPLSLLEKRHYDTTVTLLTGWTADEASMSTPTTLSDRNSTATYLSQQYPHLSQSSVAKLLSLYPVNDFQSKLPRRSPVNAHWFAAAQLLRDVTVACPTIQLACLIKNNQGNKAKGVYIYELQQSPFAETFKRYGKEHLGIVHYSDVPYLFDTLKPVYGVVDHMEEEMSRRIGQSWSFFAMGMGPDAGGLSFGVGPWPEAFKVGPDNVWVRVIGGKMNGMSVWDAKMAERCEVIERLFGQEG